MKPLKKNGHRIWLATSIVTATILSAVILLAAGPAKLTAQPPDVAEQLKKENAELRKEVADLLAAVKAQNPQPPAPLPAPAAEVPAGKFGRIKPAAIIEGPKLKVIVSPNGQKRVVPKLAAYMKPPTVTVPASVDYATKAMSSIQRMYLNDTYGDCVIAGKMHQLGIWSGNDSDSGGVILATDKEVLNQYHSICGPGDNGCVITDVLDVFKSRGLTAGGKSYKIDGYVSIDNTNAVEVKTALYLFGSLTLGIDLPAAWANSGSGGIWDVTTTKIVGGHDVCAVGYNDTGVVIATWAGLRTITWKAFASKKWITELYAQLSPTWYGNDNLSPCGVDATALKADLDALGGGTIPPVDPPIPIPPGPTPEPPLAGEWILRLPQGSKPGKYVAIPEKKAADLQQKISEIMDILGQPDDDTEADGVPDGFTTDPAIHQKLAESFKGADAVRYQRLLKRPLKHRLFMGMVARKMAADPEGAKLLKEYKAGALPPGFLDNLANFLIKIMPVILQILALFGM